MKQKAVQIGNSVGVIIPAEYRKKRGIKKGVKLDVEITLDGKLVIDKADKKRRQTTLTPEFFEWMEAFNKEYGPALDELAKK